MGPEGYMKKDINLPHENVDHYTARKIATNFWK